MIETNRTEIEKMMPICWSLIMDWSL